MLLRAILDQVAQGRSVTVSPAPGFPDWAEVTITAPDGRVVADSSCEPTEHSLRHLIRMLAAQLEVDA